MKPMQLNDLKGIRNEVLEQADIVLSLDADGNGVLLKHRYRPWPQRFDPVHLLAMLTQGMHENMLIVVTNQGFMAKEPGEVIAELELRVEGQTKRIIELESKINAANVKIDELETQASKEPSELERHRVGQ